MWWTILISIIALGISILTLVWHIVNSRPYVSIEKIDLDTKSKGNIILNFSIKNHGEKLARKLKIDSIYYRRTDIKSGVQKRLFPEEEYKLSITPQFTEKILFPNVDSKIQMLLYTDNIDANNIIDFYDLHASISYKYHRCWPPFRKLYQTNQKFRYEDNKYIELEANCK